MRWISRIAPLALALRHAPPSADAAERHPLVMYNRDRTASFPAAMISYTFDGKTGKNIKSKE